MKKIVTVVGARPQFIKASVFRKLCVACNELEEVLVHTGQHYDTAMSEQIFEDLDIAPPEYNLDIQGATHGVATGRMLEAIENVLLKEQPDACLVYGDTNSTVAAALAAAKLHVPVIHVEAGLRSFNKHMPEEINRIMTDHVSEMLFCSTHAGVQNLKNENIRKNVFLVGDIMYDAMILTSEKARQIKVVQGIDLDTENLAVCTLHRAENTDTKEKLSALITYLNEQAEKYTIILPMHPRTKNALKRHNISVGSLKTIEPVGYLDMQALLGASSMVFTDSGGLQKEAYFHKTPCVTLRQETEWIELIDAGWNRLWTVPHFGPKSSISEYGNGNSGQLIMKAILSHLAV